MLKAPGHDEQTYVLVVQKRTNYAPSGGLICLEVAKGLITNGNIRFIATLITTDFMINFDLLLINLNRLI